MCLGIPGRVVERLEHERLARVDVEGVRRVVDVGLLDDDPVAVGDWVLIHVGFAIAKIDEAEAAAALETLRMMGAAYADEVGVMRATAAGDRGPG